VLTGRQQRDAGSRARTQGKGEARVSTDAEKILALLDRLEDSHFTEPFGECEIRLVAALRVAVPYIAYIADSPPPKFGGFTDAARENAQAALAAMRAALEKK